LVENFFDSREMQVGRFTYLTKRQTGFPRQLETLAPCFAGFVVLAAGSLELRLRALHGGASIPCRIVRHPVQTIPREPVASVAVDTVKAWPTRPNTPAQK